MVNELGALDGEVVTGASIKIAEKARGMKDVAWKFTELVKLPGYKSHVGRDQTVAGFSLGVNSPLRKRIHHARKSSWPTGKLAPLTAPRAIPVSDT
jgi:hypothetical protein